MTQYILREANGKTYFQTATGNWKEIIKLNAVPPKDQRVKKSRAARFQVARGFKNIFGN